MTTATTPSAVVPGTGLHALRARPSQRARATYSLTQALRLPEGSPEQDQALERHFAEFVPPLRRACRLYR